MTTSLRRTSDAAAVAPSSPSDDGDYDEVACEECGSGGREDELLLCDKCDRGYHLFCLKPILPCVPNGSWFCFSCISQEKLKPFPLLQTKLVDFFQIQKCSSRPPFKSHSDRSKKRRHSGLVIAKKRRRLLPFNPNVDEKKRLEQMASLATALSATGTKFSDELTYGRGMAPRSANRSVLESGGMQVVKHAWL